MTGTLINVGAIIMAGSVGLLLRKGIAQRYSRSIQDGLGLLVLIIGIGYALKAENLAAIGISLALGAVIGEWRNWENGLEKLGQSLERFSGRGDSQFVKGFVSASLLFCVGAMAIVGALEDGLTGNHQILLIKSMLDGIFAMIFAASMGIGAIFSAIPVLLYQGSISLLANLLKPLLTDPVINDITALGGILIAGLGTNLLGITRIRVANLLPAILLLPFLLFLLSFLPEY
jgi:hypothetical protein